MKKATQKAAPVNLGTKRSCPECNTKFYDFGKSEIVCPKCETALDAEALDPIARLQADNKRARAVEKAAEPVVASDDVVAVETDEVIESVDDLGDDDVVEEIEVDDEDDDEEF